ncbi:MAG: pilus assembly protein [Micavibrio sp.]|nr:pilus assembly protein [Micavibrio sp.]
MRRNFKRWLRGDDAATAVEFAMVVPPLLTLIIGILEVSMFFAAGTVLEGGSAQAARLIRTGQVQMSSDPQKTFATSLCSNIKAMLDCTKVQYEVIEATGDTFLNAATTKPTIDSNGNLVPKSFASGKSNSVIIVRSYYKWEFFTPYLGSMMTGSMDKNWLPLMSTVVIKSEPYNAADSSG